MVNVRFLGLQPYLPVWEDMKQFTSNRNPDTVDELWLLEHPPVFTQGQAGKDEHILNANGIPIVKSDRGGQVTYHGPGQLVAYVLVDIKRRHLGIRTLVQQLEQVLIVLLQHYGVVAQTRCGAPGIYIDGKKIASIGLRVKNGCTYHGIAINVNMDLSPFSGINPCGYAALEMTELSQFVSNCCVDDVSQRFSRHFMDVFGP